MPRRNPDLLDQHIRLREDARRSRIYHPVYSDTKTFLVPGDIAAGVKIPPYLISMTPSFAAGDVVNDRDPQELKLLKAYCGKLEAGSAVIRPKLNGVFVGPNLTVASTVGSHWVRVDADAEAISDRDRLTFEVVSVSAGATDLSASFLMEIHPGTSTEGIDSDVLG